MDGVDVCCGWAGNAFEDDDDDEYEDENIGYRLLIMRSAVSAR
jgi:hypothetical protein